MSLIERHEQILDKCVDSLKTWQKLIAEYLDGEDKNIELKNLEQITKSYCELQNNFQTSIKVLEVVEEESNENEEANKDIQRLYESQLKKESEPLNYEESDIWQRIFVDETEVIEVKQKKTTIDASQFEELGDSLLCSNVFTPPIDPITKAVIRNPYKSKKCKHVYEHSTIVDYIKQQRRRAKCPYIGCKRNALLMSDLIEDKQLQTQITQYLETQRLDSEGDSD